jgi:hypothetical protein
MNRSRRQAEGARGERWVVKISGEKNWNSANIDYLIVHHNFRN